MQLPPGAAFAATLGLISFVFLPLASGGYSGTGYQVGFVLLPIAAAIGWAVARERPRAAVLALLLVLFSGGLCLLWLNAGRVQWHVLLHLPTAWVVAWVLLRQVPERAKWLWPTLIGGAVLSAAYGWYFWLAAGAIDAHMLGTFGLHNAFAGFLLLAWPFALVGALVVPQPLWRWLLAASGLFLAITLVLTYSRAAWVAFFLQLLALAAWFAWRCVKARRSDQPAATDKLLLYGGGSLLGTLLLLLTMPPVRSVLARVADFGGYSMTGRLRYWQAALDMLTDHPWTGVGLGGFSNFYPAYQQDFLYYSIDPHSWVLQLLAELGLGGVFVALAVLAGAAWWAVRLYRATKLGPVAMLLIIAVGGSLAHAAVDFDYTFGATTMLLGVILAYGAHLATPRRGQFGEPVPPAHAKPPLRPKWAKPVVIITVILFLAAAASGESLTAERYVLDRWRAAKDPVTGMTTLFPEAHRALRIQASEMTQQEVREQGGELARLEIVAQRDLINRAVRYNPFNHTTRRLLARNLATPGSERDIDGALNHLNWTLKFNPRDDQALFLKADLVGDPREAEALVLAAIELSPYNHPEYYDRYALLAQDDVERRKRVLWALERLPISEPMGLDFVRFGWHRYNKTFADWYYFLYENSESETEKHEYRRIWAKFQAWLDGQDDLLGPGNSLT